MQIDAAKALLIALSKAIDEAEQNNRATVDLRPQLQQLDDQARAELQAAIDAHSQE